MTFSTYDTSLIIRMDTGRIRPIWHRLRNLLLSLGWSIAPEQRINKCIRAYHHLGQKNHLQVVAEYSDRGKYNPRAEHGGSIKFEFFQDIVRENRNGGRYDFNKRQKMPYLIGKQYELTLRKLATFLEALGFKNEIEAPALTAKDQIRRRAKGCWHIKGDLFTEHTSTATYNNQDADRQTLTPGCIRYTYHRGRLIRGTCYYNINNMWWFVPAHDWLQNKASHELFSWRPDLTRRQRYTPAQRRQRLDQEMQRAVKSGHYLRAHELQTLLQRPAA